MIDFGKIVKSASKVKMVLQIVCCFSDDCVCFWGFKDEPRS